MPSLKQIQFIIKINLPDKVCTNKGLIVCSTLFTIASMFIFLDVSLKLRVSFERSDCGRDYWSFIQQLTIIWANRVNIYRAS